MNPDHTPASSANIMIVDDLPANLRIMTDILNRRGYSTRPVPSGRLALQAIEIEPPDLILLDISMPEQDGFEVCQTLKADPRFAEIPVIFISALTETIDKVKAFSVGGVDYITKPIQVEEVYARVEIQLKVRQLQLELERTIQTLELRVQAQVKEISDAQIATIFALAKLAESRDDETGKHLDRVRTYCRLLAAGCSQHPNYQSQITDIFIENIYHASPLHDIGKVGIPDRILLKPGKLTSEEFAVMKLHPGIGFETLQAVSRQYPENTILNMGIAIARHHHERWDGSGYPDGLIGDQIPLSARLMAVADIYDALRSKRVYKPAFNPEQTYEIITKSSGTHLDPGLVGVYQDLHAALDQVYEELMEKAEIMAVGVFDVSSV